MARKKEELMEQMISTVDEELGAGETTEVSVEIDTDTENPDEDYENTESTSEDLTESLCDKESTAVADLSEPDDTESLAPDNLNIEEDMSLDELLAEMDQETETVISETEQPPAEEKPKRTGRKRRSSGISDTAEMEVSASAEDTFEAQNTPDIDTETKVVPEQDPQTTSPAPRRRSLTVSDKVPILTLEVRGEIETEESRDDVIWHEIHNAYRTRRILTGQLGGVEQTDGGKTIAIVDYKGFRIVIPMKEMMINLGRMPSGQEYAELMLRQNKILGNMLGAEVDFLVRGIDSKTRSVVASRREAMLKKRQIFYLDTDSSGAYRIFEGRVVQARVIAVAEKVVRVEIFGVECSIMARDLAWDWIGDAHERFSVGDQVLVRILGVRCDSLEDISVQADIKSVSQNTNQENLKKCRIQSKYAGKVTDVHKGVVYIRLSNGVNAVAHSCYDYRTPGKKDEVSFAVTRIDEERGVAVGIITRIIRQNL